MVASGTVEANNYCAWKSVYTHEIPTINVKGKDLASGDEGKFLTDR